MGCDVLSLRQMMVLLMVALLAPAADVLPGLTAYTAGHAGWAAVLCALPLLLLALWAAGRACRKDKGKGIARAIIIMVYLLWVPLGLAVTLCRCAARLAVIYGAGAAAACAAAVLMAAVWMSWGKVSALARAAEIFYLALSVALVVVLLLAAGKVEWSNLRPTVPGLAGAPRGGLAVAGLLLNVTPAAVLGRQVAPNPLNRRKVVGWTVAFGVAVLLLVAAVIGCLGPSLTGRLPTPFLTMVQGLGAKGAFQRTEALFAALWTLSDLVGIGLLLHAWRALAGELHAGSWCRWSILPVAALAVLGSWLLIRNNDASQIVFVRILPVAGIILGLLVPILSGFGPSAQKNKRE